MTATISATGTEVTTSLSLALGDANRVFIEDERLTSNDLVTYYGIAQNWQASPPAVIAVDGVLADPGAYTLSLVSGRVTFDDTRLNTDIVSASYWFVPFDAAAITDLAMTAVYSIELWTGRTYDETALPRSFQPLIVRVAYTTALRSLMSGRLDYYKYITASQTVDKVSLGARYLKAIQQEEVWIREQVTYLQYQNVTDGSTVDMRFDRGLQPTPFSRYIPMFGFR